MAGGAFVAEVGQRDPFLDAALEQRLEVPAMQRECLAHPGRLKGPRQDLPADQSFALCHCLRSSVATRFGL